MYEPVPLDRDNCSNTSLDKISEISTILIPTVATISSLRD